MELIAWALHRYVMHGFLWNVHKDHHVFKKEDVFKLQMNDFFALFFAVPSFLSIVYGAAFQSSAVSGFGYGIMAYGFCYFTIHEVLIHRRFFRKSKLVRKVNRLSYFKKIARAHYRHHSKKTKQGSYEHGLMVTDEMISKFLEFLRFSKLISKPCEKISS
jgi:beta-carotene 3-hydroxylase